MRLSDYVPNTALDAVSFLRTELAPYPGRVNVALRCVLTSAIVIVTSMALQVPSLALSLLVVFYVTQSNVVITRLVGLMFIIGSTLAIGSSILLLKFTFDYPLLRILAASALFFCSVYLMRILKVGVVFFIVAIVIIYVQTFVDQTDQAEILVRAVLWVWIAVNYPIALTLLINTVLLPAEPQKQLKAEIHRQLATVDAHLARLIDGVYAPTQITLPAIQQGALTLQKLLKFAMMRDARYRESQTYQLARIASVSRIYQAAGELPASLPGAPATLSGMLQELRVNCRALDEAAGADRSYRFVSAATPEQRATADMLAAAGEIQRALHAFSDVGAQYGPAAGKAAPKEPLVAPDAFANPAYARFSLKALLAVLLCYLFYDAADWQGAHTIMLTCVIVALPSLGASIQRAGLRVAGAIAGSALALFMVVFIMPRLDSIVGLLLMTLPVVTLAAWIAAGSERIGYAGIQLLFTFSLALLERFGPTTDLTEIRDRMIGILLGVGISAFIQMSFWPEGEGDLLRGKLASMLRSVSALLRTPLTAVTSPEELPYSRQQLQAWAALGDCEATLARVALEPNWQEGEQTQLTMRAQTVLAQGREIMLAGNALRNAMNTDEGRLSDETRNAVRDIQEQAAARLLLYSEELAANPPVARAPRDIGMATLQGQALDALLQENVHNLLRELRGLPDWSVPIALPMNLGEVHQHD